MVLEAGWQWLGGGGWGDGGWLVVAGWWWLVGSGWLVVAGVVVFILTIGFM